MQTGRERAPYDTYPGAKQDHHQDTKVPSADGATAHSPIGAPAATVAGVSSVAIRSVDRTEKASRIDPVAAIKLVVHVANLVARNAFAARASGSRNNFVLSILTVCTGNVCRSPLAAVLLAQQLSGLDVELSSAGTRARPGMIMTPEAQHVAVELGATPRDASAHSSKLLDETQLRSADFVVAMARDHRRAIVELNPSLARTAFTVRELARLISDVGDDELSLEGAQADAKDPQARLARMLSFAAGRRGIVPPPDSPEDDDVIDPYRRSRRTYALSGVQLTAALPAVERLIRLALST